ncbi:hypothetical protein HAX54_044202, partial [Datura stramonium]|nr:hypothetical protein [Datura stramonium]
MDYGMRNEIKWHLESNRGHEEALACSTTCHRTMIQSWNLEGYKTVRLRNGNVPQRRISTIAIVPRWASLNDRHRATEMDWRVQQCSMLG